MQAVNAAINQKLRKLNDEQGSFTIEASLVMPFILLSTVVLLFAAIYTYQQVFIHKAASTAANRTAYIWDNSFKNVVTGSFTPGQNDGLYWRMTSDNVLGIFGLLTKIPPVSVKLPLTEQAGETKGPLKKMIIAGKLIPKRLQGSLQYSNFGLLRKVSVQLNKPIYAPILHDFLSVRMIEETAYSNVIDPVEFIRLIDAARTYIPSLRERITPEDARSLWIEPESGSAQSQTLIQSERDASDYIRKLVGGSEVKLKTISGQNRIIDALDNSGVAHLAFYTYTESQLRNVQMLKDSDLLIEGNVKGVVWHFFKTTGREANGPSPELRHELEKRGIVVVVHK